jgi:hypothetical protein
MDRSEMNDQTLSDDDATALMAGSLPEDRPDLVVLAAAIVDFRDAFAEPAPQPSPELMSWLTGAPALLLLHGTESAAPAATPVRACARARLRRRIRTAANALAGLGVTAKFALGGTAALAAVAAGGAVGVLPEKPQAVFDGIIDNDHADPPLPRTPLDKSATTDAGPDADAGAESGEQRHTEQRSPSQNSSERQDRDSGDRRSQDATSPRDGETDPAPGLDGSDDSDDSDNESQEDPDDHSDDDQSDDESQEDPDDHSDDDQSDDDGSGADDTEEIDGSSDDAADADGSSNSAEDADDVDAETSEWNFD